MNHQVDRKPPTCPKCQMKFARKDNLMRHLRSQHSINIMVPCKLCDKMFETNLKHSDHMKLEHHKTTKFNYEKCGKYFDNRKNQRSHQNTVQCTKSKTQVLKSNHSDAKIISVKIESLKPAVKSEPLTESDIMELDVEMSKATALKIEQFESEMIKREIDPVTQIAKLEPNVYSNVIYFSKSETTVKSNATCNIKSNPKRKVIPRKPSLKRSWPKIYDFAGYSKKIKVDPNSSLENVETNQNKQDSNATTCGSLMAKLKALEAQLDEMNKEFDIQTKQSEENLKELKAKLQEESKQFDLMTTELTNKRLLKGVFQVDNVFYMWQ